MPVLFSQIPAALLAVYVVGGLWGGAGFLNNRLKKISGDPRPLDQIALFYSLLFVMSAFLALRTWFNLPAFEWMTLGLLLLGNILSIRGRLGQNKIPAARTLLVTCLLLAVLLLDFLYASLPLYRYDQWTYHLVVAKWISRMGTLTPPITYDHIFFTGSYEFLGLLPRAFSDSDTFQQGFQNSLSWLLVAVPGAALYGVNKPKTRIVLIGALAFALLCVFGSGDHEALINAKPDYVLMMTALLLLIFTLDGFLLSPVLAAFLLVAGLSFKITWLHFAVCGPIIVWGALGKRLYKDWPKILLGGILAAPCLAPWAIKNWQFFKNPLHPAQSKFFSSTLWSPMLDTYWQEITLKPKGFHAFISNFFQAALGLPSRWGWLCAVLAGIIWLSWKSSRERWQITRSHVAFAGCLLAYLGVWGVFYNAHIFNRFVAGAFAFPIGIIWFMSRQLTATKFVPILLIIPFLIYGQVDVTIMRLADGAMQTFEDLALNATKGPMQKVPDLLQIKADRLEKFPGAKFTEAGILSDFAFNYYGPSAFWVASDPVTWWHFENSGIDPIQGDGLEFLRKMNIRYVWVVDPDIFKKAPPAIQNIIERLEPMPSRLGRLYFVKF
jgi:hypothetical protein